MEEEQAQNKDLSQPTDVKKFNQKSEIKRYSEIFRDFDNLELSFTSLEGDDLMSDSCSQSEYIPTETAGLTEQHDKACADTFDRRVRPVSSDSDENQSAQEADLALCRCEDGVETALQYAKMWCRYAKDLLAWIEKRITLEQEFVKNVMKTSDAAKASLAPQEMMPLQYIYTMALEQDIKNSLNSRKTSELIHNHCYQALAAKRNEIDKWRKEFKDQWAKEQKRMNDAVTALKKAQQQYYQRCDELVKAKAVTAKTVDDAAGIKTMDKRRKSKDDAQTRVFDSEFLYHQCVSDARIQQDELGKVKERIISHIRKLICQGDTVLKEATVNMFYYQQQQTELVPLGYHNLEFTSRSLEPGKAYLMHILSKRQPEQPIHIFTFQEYNGQSKRNKRKTGNVQSHTQDSSPLTDENPYRQPSNGRRMGQSDNDGIGSSLESLSSPAHTSRRFPKTNLTGFPDDLDDRDIGSESECTDGQQVKVRALSRAALTHRLRKLKNKIIKCKQCDNYIVVGGVECEECGLGFHRKCMEICQLECEHKKGTVFGVDLSALMHERPDRVHFVVLRCTSEIESRALSLQGVYRVSGSKPRIQKLCQAFELQKEHVDLSELSPHDITSILKHFFKELPEPLLTFDLYNDLMAVGKTIHHQSESTAEMTEIGDIIHKLQALLQKLPSYCYGTLQHLICHLHKVSENTENKMSPSNLGIVFGPTLLRPLIASEMSMIALLENSYQAALIEFLITHHDKVFGLAQRPETPTPPVPTATLPESPLGRSCPVDGGHPEGGRPASVSSKDHPNLLETRKIKRESSEGYISDKSSSNEAVDQLSPEATDRAVLAMKSSSDNRSRPPEDSDSVFVTQPHYRFTRQPVKYHRHQKPGVQLPQPSHPARQSAHQTVDGPGSAYSSAGCSPERAEKRLTQSLDLSCESGDEASGNKPDVMLGLGSVFPSVAAETPSDAARGFLLQPATADPTDPSVGLSSNRPGCGQRPDLNQRNATSPAEKILSGLRRRGSHSGKDEQLFV